jgi:hypothetical protein
MPATTNGKFTLDLLRSHQVYKNAAGKRVPGVTTVQGIIEKPGLHKWFWQCGQDGIDPNKKRDEAAAIGTVAHARVEAFLRGMELDETGIAPDRLDKSANAFLSFMEWWKKEQFTVIESELQMVSERWQVGGTLDILAARPSRNLVLVDVKTSNGIFNEAFTQSCAYSEMYEETHPGRHVDEIIIAHLPKDESGECIPHPVKDAHRPLYVAAFVAANNAYHAWNSLPRVV